MMSFRFLTCTQLISVLINSFADDALQHASACVNEALVHVADIADSCLVHAFLH